MRFRRETGSKEVVWAVRSDEFASTSHSPLLTVSHYTNTLQWQHRHAPLQEEIVATTDSDWQGDDRKAESKRTGLDKSRIKLSNALLAFASKRWTTA